VADGDYAVTSKTWAVVIVGYQHLASPALTNQLSTILMIIPLISLVAGTVKTQPRKILPSYFHLMLFRLRFMTATPMIAPVIH
jgi:hypothetical protein